MEVEPDTFATDVLVIGGGPAGTWAALAAAEAGAAVTLVDKGFVGTSGVAAAAGPGHWWVPPEGREAAVRDRLERSLGLGEAAWMEAILEETWRSLPRLESVYRFGCDEEGRPQYRSLRGPEYMRAMRRLVEEGGVRILDHHPALELLQDAGGGVTGAAGWSLADERAWAARAGAVVLATGGCAFASRLHGARNNTGDGHLMAAEVGAEVSGMEFSAYYSQGPLEVANTRSMLFAFARYFDADGRELDIPPGERPEPLARALLAGPVFCTLERTPEDVRAMMPSVQPNFLLPFHRAGIDPFRDRFRVTLLGEGTIRGVGGVRVVERDGRTGVEGLFVAGDLASREAVTGAISGGGAVNSSWALSSGQWAGRAAARLADTRAPHAIGRVRGAGRAGLCPTGSPTSVDASVVVAVAHAQMTPYDRNLFRTGVGLRASRDALEAAWREVVGAGRAEGRGAVRLREAAAMTACARWCVAAASERVESRGQHQRLDAPTLDPAAARRLRAGGLDEVWARFDPAPARQPDAA